MPDLTTIMVLANVGLQLFNNWRSRNTNEEIRKKQQEFQEALQQRNHNLMMQLLREGHELQENIEWQMHEQRVENIAKDFDNIIQTVFASAALGQWPLRVLPMVMKNQSLGSYRLQHDENIALHVIFTPSNCPKFNASVFPQIEQGVEFFLNRYWHTLSAHPILFYSGAWKSNEAPTGNEIAQLKSQLPNLPVLMITPFFRPDQKLVFNIHLWGIGEAQDIVIQPSEQEFSYYNLYAPDITYGEKLATTTIEEFVPYIQSVIGYFADIYFWSVHRRPPILPCLYALHTQCPDKIKNRLAGMYSAYFDKLEAELTSHPQNIFPDVANTLLMYLAATTRILDPEKCHEQCGKLFLLACRSRGLTETEVTKAIIKSVNDNIFLPCDDLFLNKFTRLYSAPNISITPQTNKKNMKTLSPQEYSDKRDDLLLLIDQALNVKELKKDETQLFKVTKKRLQENQFNIVLIGEFQGGKSTTFNALCGGREISPRGAMNKTSAICITATNLSNPKDNEYAMVHWKSDAELLSLMDTFAGLVTPEDLGVTLKNNEKFSVFQHFSFTESQHIKALMNALDLQEKTYKYDIDKYQEYNEILRISKLILAFANDPNLVKIRQKSQYEITEVAKFAVFPDNWNQRWNNVQTVEDIKKQFKLEDVLFAFVGSVDCYIHSKNLAYLGCSITDCPGLFASSWDTSVALNAMAEANAVIYLLGGNKTMGEGDKRAIAKIVQHQTLSDKIFFALNQKENETITSNILSENQSILIDLGVQNYAIAKFNSLLFFMSEFGTAFLQNSLDEYSKEKFIMVAKRNSGNIETNTTIQTVWQKIINSQAGRLEKDELFNYTDINKTNICNVRKESYADVLLSSVNNSIISQKAESILITNGANKIKDSLDAIEERLKIAETDILKSVVQCEAECKAAEKAYDSFKKQVENLLNETFTDSLALQIASNGYEEIFQEDTIQKITNRMARQIPKVIGLKMSQDALFSQLVSTLGIQATWATDRAKESKKRLQELLQPIVTTSIQIELNTSIDLWKKAVFCGMHPDLKELLSPQLDKLSDQIMQKWNKSISKDIILSELNIKGVTLELTGVTTNLSGAVISNQMTYDNIGGAVFNSMLKNITSTIVQLVIGIIVTIILVILLEAPVSVVIIGLAYSLKYIPDWQRDRNLEKLNVLQKQIYDKLLPQLLAEFKNKDFKQNIISTLAVVPKQMSNNYKEYYNKQLKSQEKKLQNIIKNKIELKKKSLESQEKVTSNANEIRTKKIQPLLDKINSFIRSCY